MSRLEHDMSNFDAVLRKRGYTPSIWPVQGTLESGFGGRRNPFGGSGFEFHSGQDIEAAQGTPVIAGARGIVAFSRLAKWIWSTRSCRSWWRSEYPLRAPVSYRHQGFIRPECRSGAISEDELASTGRSTGPSPALRSSHQ